jgi:uncharacterized protein (DUF736 family)
MSTIGTVTRQKDGRFVGSLKTLSVNAPIEITPVKKKAAENGPDYMITSRGIECGAAWIRKGQRSGNDYVSCSFSAPEFGSEPLYANLGVLAGQDDEDVFALIWNPKRKQ